MALRFLKPPLQVLDSVFPRSDLDFPMSDESHIGSFALAFESNLDLMIRNLCLKLSRRLRSFLLRPVQCLTRQTVSVFRRGSE